jgi:hypothetical protein
MGGKLRATEELNKGAKKNGDGTDISKVQR